MLKHVRAELKHLLMYNMLVGKLLSIYVSYRVLGK